MDFKHIQGWAEDHPLGTAAIIIGGGLALLYFLGFFSKSSGGSASAGNPGLAQAYYAVEATQAAAGTQLQIAQTNAAASTAQAQIAANAATTINANNNQTAWNLGSYTSYLKTAAQMNSEYNATAVELNALSQHGFAIPVTTPTGLTYG